LRGALEGAVEGTGEVDAENGCVRYVKRSHRDGMREHGRTGTLGFSQGMTDFGSDDDLAREAYEKELGEQQKGKIGWVE
jgi:hypothetical protein